MCCENEVGGGRWAVGSGKRRMRVTAARCRLPTAHYPTAFSLIEMMAVLVLIGLLAGLVIVNVRPLMVRGKQDAARGQISNFASALESFHGFYGRYPTSDEGLALMTQKSAKLSEPLLRSVPLDPWGHAYQYNSPGRTEPYEVISYGADGREGGTGADADIESWQLQEAAGSANASTP